MSEAIEKAEKVLASSADEDAFMLAELIHNLALQVKTTRYESIANGRDLKDPYTRSAQVNGDIKTVYVSADNGEAKNPDGNPVKSIRQFIEDAEKAKEGLWKQAADEELTRHVKEKLPEVQQKALERMKNPPQQ